MADIFTPEQAEALASMGEGIGGILQDRFHQKQFEDFQQNEYAEYQRGLQNISDVFLTSDDPDALQKGMLEMKNLNNTMMTAAARYQRNPYISNLASSHMQHDTMMFQQLFGAGLEERAAEQQFEREAPGRELEAQKTGAEIEAQRALTFERGQRGRLLGVQAEREAREAEQVAPGPFLLGGMEDQEYIMGSGDPLGAARERLHAIVRNPRNERERKNLEGIRGRMTNSIASQQLRPLIGKPKPGGAFGEVYSEEDIDEFRKNVDPIEVDRAMTRHLLMSEGRNLGFSPEQVIQRNPDMFEGLLEREEREGVQPLRGPTLNRANAAQVLFGAAPENMAQNLKLGADATFSEMAKKITPANWRAILGDASPIKGVIDSVLMAEGFIPGAAGDVKFESYKDVERALMDAIELTIRKHVGGQNVPDKNLSAAEKAARRQLREVKVALVTAVAPGFASKYEIPGVPRKFGMPESLLGRGIEYITEKFGD